MTSIFEPQTFGEILQNYRKQHHMTQQVLAEKLGVRMNTLKNWEDGTSDPSVKSMIKIADEMHVPLVQIYKLIKTTS